MTPAGIWIAVAAGSTGFLVFLILRVALASGQRMHPLGRIGLHQDYDFGRPLPVDARDTSAGAPYGSSGGWRSLRAGRALHSPPRRIVVGMAVGVTAATIIALVATLAWGVSTAIAASVAAVMWRRGRARSYATRMKPQILDALDLIAATVKAGFGFVQAIEIASRELSEPLAGELRVALREIELGVAVDDALRSLSERVGDRDLSLAISALLIQRRVGGGLYEILHNIAELIRDRARVEGEIASLTAQARLSARVVGFLPVAIAGMMAIMQPSYIELLMTDPLGRLMVVLAVGFEIIGFWTIARLARIDF